MTHIPPYIRFSGFTLLAAMAVFAPHAKADLLFSLNQSSTTTVTLHQVTPTIVEVIVNLGNQYFANTGSGQHPSFAFNIVNDPVIDITNIQTNNTHPFTVGSKNVTTNGPKLGSFDYTLNAPGNGTSAKVDLLQFDVSLHNGGNLSITDFGANSKNFFFAADYGLNSNTAESGATGPGTITQESSVPEPASVALLLTAAVGCVWVQRRRTA